MLQQRLSYFVSKIDESFKNVNIFEFFWDVYEHVYIKIFNPKPNGYYSPKTYLYERSNTPIQMNGNTCIYKFTFYIFMKYGFTFVKKCSCHFVNT